MKVSNSVTQHRGSRLQRRSVVVVRKEANVSFCYVLCYLPRLHEGLIMGESNRGGSSMKERNRGWTSIGGRREEWSGEAIEFIFYRQHFEHSENELLAIQIRCHHFFHLHANSNFF